jgi:glucose-6-phosphate isomerase
VVDELVASEAVARLYAGDHTLWRDDTTEISDRLGWLHVVAEVLDGLAALRARCDRLRPDVDHVLVMGMGGSSLFPEVLARSFGTPPGQPSLHVLDTTDPAAIARIAAVCPADRTMHIASSKSGSTIETRSHLEWAWERSCDPTKFAAITDPGSELGALARDRGFADVFENRADIGGRYSALSLFGVVPALLAGVDAEALLTGGLAALAACGPDGDAAANPALALAAVLGAGVRSGRDKATLVLPPEYESFGLWLEQLLAESLGKDGTGVVPIVGEPLGSPEAYGDDRVFLVDPAELHATSARLGTDRWIHPLPPLTDARSIGFAVVVSEVATALVAAVIGVHPFDQPDVAAAKAATNEVLETGDLAVDEVALATLLDVLRPGDHLAIQAFVDPDGPAAASIAATRVALRDAYGVATSLGFGPRFLHSTGQLHKGGPRSIVCVQVVADDPHDIAIPGGDLTFGRLKQAQADGDLRTLQARGIRAGRASLEALCRRGVRT